MTTLRLTLFRVLAGTGTLWLLLSEALANISKIT